MIDRFKRLTEIERKFVFFTLFSSVAMVVIFSFVSWTLYKGVMTKNLKSNQEYIESTFYKHSKELLKREVYRAVSYIDYVKQREGSSEEFYLAALDYLETYRYGEDGYLFVIGSESGTSYLHYGKRSYGNFNFQEKYPTVYKKLLDAVESSPTNFVEYNWRKEGADKSEKKISYVVKLQDPKWIIGGGLYIQSLETELEKEQEIYRENLEEGLKVVVATTLFFIALVIVFNAFIANRLLGIFRSYRSKIVIATEKLKRANEGLENRVVQRTKELATEKERAQLADRLKTRFIANISHEIRTPINYILGFLKIIKQEAAESCATEKIEAVEESSKELLEIFNNLLEVSYLEAGVSKLHPQEVSLFQLFDELKDEFSKEFDKKKGVVLKVSVSNTIDKKVVLDEKKLKLALKNLLSNGLKFTNEGIVTLFAYMEESHLHILVKDSGVGIGDSKIIRNLEMFQQRNSEDNREFSGIGLGLYLTKKLIELMGAKIEVEGKKNIGTNVTIVFKDIEFGDLDSASTKCFVNEEDRYDVSKEEKEELTKLFPTYQELIVADDFEGYKIFASQIESVSTRYNNKKMLGLATRLKEGALNYDLDKIQNALDRYERIVSCE